MYSEMPEDEKNAWLERAEQDKARYLHELSEYVPPPGFDMKGDAISEHAEVPMVKAIKVRGKGARDPGAPKRSKSNDITDTPLIAFYLSFTNSLPCFVRHVGVSHVPKYNETKLS